MNAVLQIDATPASPDVADRIAAVDWQAVASALDAQGCAVIESLLPASQCRTLAAMYSNHGNFRSRVVMGRHGFGRGEYQYFNYPLPDSVAELRTSIYPHLQPIANRWNAAMGIDVRYPAQHAEFVTRCHRAGQTRPTPLLLQ